MYLSIALIAAQRWKNKPNKHWISRVAAALKLFQRQEGEAMLFIDFFAGIVCDGQCDL